MTPLKFDKTKLKNSHEESMLVVDLIMTVLILINLTWLVFDSLFGTELIQEFLYRVWPSFTTYYGTKIHPNFILYDFIFVAIFLTELCIRWLIAIKRKTYHRWFFYPFIHWYDVLGCIPVGSFRWLRLLRVISIFYRLQKNDIIDLKTLYPYRIIAKYINILMEEVTNRVVVNVLSSIQEEVDTGSPVISNIVDRVLEPRIPQINEWLTTQVNTITEDAYESRKADLRQYIDAAMVDLFAKNSGVERLQSLPRIGEPLTEIIEKAVSELIFDIVDTIATDMDQIDSDLLIKKISDAVFSKILEPTGGFKTNSREVLIEALEVIKDEAKVQKWKLVEEEARNPGAISTRSQI
jgi:hypothetical protein